MGFGAYGMGGFGWLGFLVLAALVVVPFWRLLPRHGIPSWVALAAVVPVFALVLLWVMAFSGERNGAGNGGAGNGGAGDGAAGDGGAGSGGR